MRALHRKSFISLAFLLLGMALLLFGPAGTLRYWQAWLFLSIYFAVSLALTLYLIRNDPALLERRMRGGPFAEREPTQKIIMSLASVGFIALLVLPAVDHRFGWSQMSPRMAVAGDLLILLGWLGIFFVFLFLILLDIGDLFTGALVFFFLLVFAQGFAIFFDQGGDFVAI